MAKTGFTRASRNTALAFAVTATLFANAASGAAAGVLTDSTDQCSQTSVECVDSVQEADAGVDALAGATSDPTSALPGPSVATEPLTVTKTRVVTVETISKTLVLAFAGLSIAYVLSVILAFYAVRRWKVSLRGQEFTVVPNEFVNRASHDLNSLGAHVAGTGSAMNELAGSVQATREEFGILRREIDAQRAEITTLRAGALLEYQRSVLGAMARALEIIESDLVRDVPSEKTLKGVRVELADALDEHGVQQWVPEVGSNASGSVASR